MPLTAEQAKWAYDAAVERRHAAEVALEKAKDAATQAAVQMIRALEVLEEAETREGGH